MTGSGTGLTMNFVKKVTETRVFTRGTHLLGFDVDLEADAFPGTEDGIMITASFYDKFKVWRIHDLANPEVFAAVYSDPGNTLASLAYPVAWVGSYNWTGQETTYDLSNPSSPQLLDDAFWDGGLPPDGTQPWNDWPCFRIQTGSTFAGGGRFLFSGRYEVLQRFDFGGCGVPERTMFDSGFENGDTSDWSVTVP